MKKITALMLSSAMMLSLAACGGSASTETVSSEAASSEAASSEAVSTEEAASADAAAVTTVNAGKLTKSVFYAWSEEARKKKEDCDNGTITPEDFSRWLKES